MTEEQWYYKSVNLQRSAYEAEMMNSELQEEK